MNRRPSASTRTSESFQQTTTSTENEPIDLTVSDLQPLGTEVQHLNEPMDITSPLENNVAPNNWWETGFAILCGNCKSENVIVHNNSVFECWHCNEKSFIVKPCCAIEDDPKSYFSVSVDTQKPKCVKCDKVMNYLPCCKNIVPINFVDQTVFNCGVCEKQYLECHCKRINLLPSKGLAVTCKNLQCHYKMIHCDCGKKSVQLFEGMTPYECECECEFEYDIEIGITKSY